MCLAIPGRVVEIVDEQALAKVVVPRGEPSPLRPDAGVRAGAGGAP